MSACSRCWRSSAAPGSPAWAGPRIALTPWSMPSRTWPRVGHTVSVEWSEVVACHREMGRGGAIGAPA